MDINIRPFCDPKSFHLLFLFASTVVAGIVSDFLLFIKHLFRKKIKKKRGPEAKSLFKTPSKKQAVKALTLFIVRHRILLHGDQAAAA